MFQRTEVCSWSSQLRGAAPDVVVALVFALGLSVVSAAGLALVLRDLQADVAFSAHVGEHRGLRRRRAYKRARRIELIEPDSSVCRHTSNVTKHAAI